MEGGEKALGKVRGRLGNSSVPGKLERNGK